MSTSLPLRWMNWCVVAAVLVVGCGSEAGTEESDGGDEPAELATTQPDAPGAASTAPASTAPAPTAPAPTGGDTNDPAPPWWPSDPRSSTSVTRWTVEIVERIDHDPAAYTQGLEVDGDIGFESTGRRGESTIRRFDPTTGAVIASVALDDAYFGEGLTVVGDTVIQLTWQAGTALRWDRATLTAGESSSYEGQGWGLCESGDQLVLSDGTPQVRLVAPATFVVEATTEVTLEGEPVSLLNELECVDDLVVANVWKTSRLVVFDPATGVVTAEIDAAPLADEMAATVAENEQNALNGVAALDDGTFLFSGKRWPTTFRVRLVAA